MITKKEFFQITISTLNNEQQTFTGRYLPERQTENWHYYETENGNIFHYRKKNMIFVKQCRIEKKEKK